MTPPEITQDDRRLYAIILRAFGFYADANALIEGTYEIEGDDEVCILALATQRQSYEARIAELEAERDAAIRRKVAAMDDRDTEEARALAAEAELDALKSQKWDVKHTDTMNTIVQLGIARDAAEAKLAEAVEVIRPFALCPESGRDGGEFVIAKALYHDMKDWNDIPPRAAHWHMDQFRRAARFVEENGK
ncbi:hypothetical protein SAMN06295912_1403 [Sphingomonas laterariae]|uniref:Uncharacterized protein n=1 Tax=Edaphosphingomonas laterariae TaxID=861865 RepID=A0A239JVT5_9SPHN|nr:hypothetical protein [Sphingomonas laterariae]SNT09503.1 hypothetical protein SAMN06295912_1403 [Sphingomonas laterariae]